MGASSTTIRDVDETVVDFLPLDITDLKIGSSGELIIQIADETVGSTKYSINCLLLKTARDSTG